MYLRSTTLALMFLSSTVCLAQPPGDKAPATKVELVYSGNRLEKLIGKFSKKLESKELAAVFSPGMESEYEAVLLNVQLTRKPTEIDVSSIKVYATLKKAEPPRAKLIETLAPDHKDFNTILNAIKPELLEAAPKAERNNYIVGIWKTKGASGEGVIVEFTKDADANLWVVDEKGNEVKMKGVYFVEGDKLNMTLKSGDNKEEKKIWTLVAVTEKGFSTKNEKGLETDFVRLKK